MAKAPATTDTDTPVPPTISVMERRLQRGVFNGASSGIPLKKPKEWVTRIVDAKQTNDRPWVMQEKGWVYLELADLAVSPESIGYRATPEGRIVRGEQGRDVVMKMPMADWNRLNKAKSDANIRDTFGKKQIKSAIVNGVAGSHGSQAADFVNSAVNTLDVRDSRERVSLDD